MLDWHKALQTVKAHQKKHHEKAARRNKKGFEGQDRYYYVYIRHTLELADRIKETRRLLKALEFIDKLRHEKEKSRDKTAGRNRREVRH